MMPNHKRKEIIKWIEVFPIEIRTSILKLVIREALLMKPNHQSHKSRKGEFVYDAQSRNERRLLCESMLNTIEIRTSILNLVIREAFLMKPKHQFH